MNIDDDEGRRRVCLVVAVAVEVLYIYIYTTSYTPFSAGVRGRDDDDSFFLVGGGACVGLGFLCHLFLESIFSLLFLGIYQTCVLVPTNEGMTFVFINCVCGHCGTKRHIGGRNLMVAA